MLSSYVLSVQLASARALIGIGQPVSDVLPVLQRIVTTGRKPEKDSYWASEAVEFLGSIESDHAKIAPILLQIAKDTEYPELVRMYAVRGLGRMQFQSQEISKTLQALLQDKEVGVRVEAAIRLWRVKRESRQVVPVLINALTDKESTTSDREAAIEALVSMGADAAPAIDVLRHLQQFESNELIRAKAEKAIKEILNNEKESR